MKDMLAVTEQLSEVRGQIEQQQAEFNALSRQIETVALTISLRTEAEAQVFGSELAPGLPAKTGIARRTRESRDVCDCDDDDSVLSSGCAVVGGHDSDRSDWRRGGLVRWVGRRWFGWNDQQLRAAQG